MKVILKEHLQRLAIFILTVLLLSFPVQNSFAAAAKWIKIGSLHNFYQEHGCEPEEDFGDEQQFGLRWPAFHPRQDCQAARGFWIACKNYNDPIAGVQFSHKVAHCGPRPRPSIEQDEMMPVPFAESETGLLMYGRIPHPQVFVDGEPSSDLDYDDIVEIIDPSLKADRLLVNVINSSIGISMTRKIYAFSQQYYDNFFVYEYTFKNTGICSKPDANGNVRTHNDVLEGVFFHWQYRNAVCKEGTVEGRVINWRGDPGWGTIRDMRWGKNTMNESLGESPGNPVTTANYPTDNLMYEHNFGVDEYDDYGNIIRCFYSWHGLHSSSTYDNIGSPNVLGWKADGQLGASQFTGVVTLHADTDVDNPADDIYQPYTTVKIESNDLATTSNEQFSASRMTDEYLRFCSFGHSEKSQAEEVGAGFPNMEADVGGGGFSQAIAFGPYTMAPGYSIRIVLAEAVSGLSRDQNKKIGRNWYEVAIEGQTLNVEFPDGSLKDIASEDDANEYKNSWVYTSKDSLIQTYKRAINLFRNGLDLGSEFPPDPPSTFMVESQGNRIFLSWMDNAETHPRFEGYKIYRAKGETDSTYYNIADLNISDGTLANEYSDYTAVRGQSYYYYIVSYDDGSTNTISPDSSLYSSPFYTRTNKGAYLKKPPSESLKGIRVVPNPYNVRNRTLQYVGEPNKIMFLNLPEKLTIRIFTERGDLINTIKHEGSGDARWDMITSSRQIVVSGVYIAHFEVPENIYDINTGELILRKGLSTYRKFVIIR